MCHGAAGFSSLGLVCREASNPYAGRSSSLSNPYAGSRIVADRPTRVQAPSRHMDVIDRPPAPSDGPATIGKSSPSLSLQRLRSRCRACRIAFHGYRLGGDGVVQVDRSIWKADCPRAAQAGCPVGCAEFRRALRLATPAD